MQVYCKDCNKLFEIKDHLVSKHINNYGGVLCRSCSQRRQYKEGKRVSKIADYNRKQKGKTIEERLGTEKAKIFKMKLSKAFSGELNPNYGGKYSRFEAATAFQKGKTFEEMYGIERANNIKLKLSKAFSGDNNPMYGKSPSKNSGAGLKGYYKNVFYRSLLELSYMVYLDNKGIKYISAETEDFIVEYVYNNKRYTYKPDFYLLETDYIIEVKRYRMLNCIKNKLKFEAAKAKFKNFKVVTEQDFDVLTVEQIKFMIDTNQIDISGYNNKYKMWLEKHL